MEFDISAVPFSRYGSYIAFSKWPAPHGNGDLLFRTMLGVGDSREVFRVELVRDGAPVEYCCVATPGVLRLGADGAQVEICFAEPQTVRMQGHGVGLRLRSVGDHRDMGLRAGEGRWHVNCPACRSQFLLSPITGDLDVTAKHYVRTQDRSNERIPPKPPWFTATFLPAEDGCWEATIHEFESSPACYDASEDFEECVARVEREWQHWLTTMPKLPGAYRDAGELAMFVNWVSVVAPSRHLTRPTMLMSKNWMSQCWSWDHCFNAIALSYTNPDLAWDQFMVLFDYQDERGALPDSVSPKGPYWNFCKPPIHGWALRKMMRNPALLTPGRMRQAYARLRDWTNWWMEDRDYDDDGLPEYHHGNDSGWDNATVFDVGFPLISPDLAGHLIAQMDTLAELARRLGRPKEATRWEAQAAELAQRTVDVLWNGKQFMARQAFSGAANEKGDCLLNYEGVTAGTRWPEQIRDRMAEALRPGGRFLTDYGPATESPQSPLYAPDSYWRGPIWGSETTLIADGLARCGYRELAAEVARRYCDMCVRCNTFAENYNALTGEPLRDKAYTWGSSAYLILAHEFLAS